MTPANRIPLERASRFAVVTASELIAMRLPPRELILAPWLPVQGLAMLYAPRGIGKTHVALDIAYAVARGAIALSRWRAPKARPVVYLDGEMPANVIQDRLAAIINDAATEPPSPDYLRFLTPDLQHGPMPDLSTAAGQAEMEPLLDGCTLVIVGNISTLCRSGVENEGESWLPVQGWALDQRRKGRSVLFVHHSNKGVSQRGTSRREDVLDTVIALRQPADYQASDGARFEMHFEKARGFSGPEAAAFEARLILSLDGNVGRRASWEVTDIENKTTARVAELLNGGMSIRDAADELGIGKSTVARQKRKAEAMGLIHGE